MNFCYFIILLYNELINSMHLLYFVILVMSIYVILYFTFNYFCKCTAVNHLDYDSDSDIEDEDSPQVFIRRIRRNSE
jgi:hypothetical protein